MDPGKSVGSPTEGHLLGGAHLGETTYLRIVPVYQNGDARWGLAALVNLIDRSARAVNKQFPDSILSVGHLSKHGGGEIDRHASHESGRDADIGFYIKNQQNKPIYEDHFVPFLGDGTAPSWPGARFDDARNWALVSAIVGDGHTHVTHIFVSTPIRQRLLEYGAKIGAPQNIRVRASELLAQPKGSLPHDDHFHVRIGCPSGMEQCIELPQARHHAHHQGTTVASAHHSAAPHQPAAPAHAAPHAKPAPAEKTDKKEEDKKEEETASTPTLGPIVPGLDSAVIAKPLQTSDKPAERPAEKPPIDDPDGILQ
jgi:penicillin-insensitive murein endopeptidase